MKSNVATTASAETRRVYEELYGELTTLSLQVQVYKGLFKSGDNNLALLQRIASGTFWVIHNAIGHSLVLGVGRLLDPKENRSQSNLSLETLVHRLKEDGFGTLAKELRDARERLKTAASDIQEFRHKTIAHSDLDVKLQRRQLPKVTVENVESALLNVGQILNQFAHEFDRNEVAYHMSILGEGEPEALIIRLREAEAYREEVPDWMLLGDPNRETLRPHLLKKGESEN